MRRILLFIFLLNGAFSVYCQSDFYDRKQKNQFWDGESFYIYGDYLTTIEKLEPLIGLDPTFNELHFLIGDSYFQLKKFQKAKPFLEKGIKFNRDALFLLAKIQLYFSELDSVLFYADKFEGSFEEKSSSFTKKDISRIRANVNNAKKFMADAEVVNISNLGSAVNSENEEYVPLISSYEELLIFTSRRMHPENQLDPEGLPFEDIYFSERESSKDRWSDAKLLVGEVNTPKHDACVGLSPDGNILFVFRTNDNLVGGDLYESIQLDGKWTTTVRMSEKINDYYSIEPSASISLDERTFYFSSNREGGYGGFDIYRVVKLPNNEWSLPLNLGPKINTSLDEDAPFIHPDGVTLYFSSQGHRNMGGFDIFKSTKMDTSWSEPENLGFPTNTTKDEIYFSISANEQHGYYSSDKEGGFGGQDIYQIDYLEKSLRQSVVRGIVKDAATDEPIQADISLLGLEDGELRGVFLSNPENGNFIFLVNPEVEYDILIEANGYEEQSQIIKYSVADLMESQKVNFHLKPTAAE